MAHDARHAADRQRYEVHEALEGEPPVDLGLRFQTSSLGMAVDFAFDYLERRDPLREGAVSVLEVVRVEGPSRETVWRYSYAPAGSHGDPTRVWGFDVTRHWSGPYRTPARPNAVRR